MKYWKQGMYISILAVFIVMFFIIIKDYSNKHQVVAQVGEKELIEKELISYLNEMYRETALNKMVGDDLIKQEIKKLGYGPLNKEEEKKAAKYYKLVNNLNDDDIKELENQKRELELFYHTLKLFKKYTITESELEKFWATEKNIALPATYYLRVYKDNDHSKLQQIEDDLATGSTSQQIEQKFGVEFQNVIVDEAHSAYSTLEGLKAGEFVHSHDYIDENVSHLGNHDEHNGNSKETHNTHDDHNSEDGVQNAETSHAIILLDEIKKETDKNLENNKEEIMDFYATKKIYKEKIELVNYLKSKYPVKVEQ
jgi:nitrate/nitrite-specific signal transduction histidine kinase